MLAWFAMEQPGRPDLVPLPLPPELGAIWDAENEEWLPPSPSVPEAVTPLAFGLALIESGISLATIKGMLAEAGEKAQWIWDRAQTFRRDHELVLQFAAVLELTEAEVDAIFVRAKELEETL